MIIVTGGAGFIGSNIVKELNNRGHEDIIVVDDLTDGEKFVNLVDCKINDYWDKDDFIEKVQAKFDFPDYIEAIIHQGACSDTTEWNGHYMMENNFEYSKILFHYCTDNNIPLIYASSAAVYGGSEMFREEEEYEKPLNIYGYSKLLFDRYVRRRLPDLNSQVVGLRYFNVYGPREQHKDSMASVAWHLYNQIKETNTVKLFGEYDGHAAGEQKRDFIYVTDVVDVVLWMLDNSEVSGIFNLGTGCAEPFNQIARTIIDWRDNGSIEYIDFPEHLKGHYQSFTEADIAHLRVAGYKEKFKSVTDGVRAYIDWLESR